LFIAGREAAICPHQSSEAALAFGMPWAVRKTKRLQPVANETVKAPSYAGPMLCHAMPGSSLRYKPGGPLPSLQPGSGQQLSNTKFDNNTTEQQIEALPNKRLQTSTPRHETLAKHLQTRDCR